MKARDKVLVGLGPATGIMFVAFGAYFLFYGLERLFSTGSSQMYSLTIGSLGFGWILIGVCLLLRLVPRLVRESKDEAS